MSSFCNVFTDQGNHTLSNAALKSVNMVNVGQFEASTVSRRSSISEIILGCNLLCAVNPDYSSVWIFFFVTPFLNSLDYNPFQPFPKFGNLQKSIEDVLQSDTFHIHMISKFLLLLCFFGRIYISIK
jgi:hypothetical protein